MCGAAASALRNDGMVQAARLPGCLILVVGPSGVGKDSLLDAARGHFENRADLLFTRRVITRPADAGGETHIPVSAPAFRTLAAEGGFALHWEAHGLSYGLPITINPALSNGQHIVANVSRTVLDDARARFGKVAVLSVVADPAVLAERLRKRGREAGIDLESRLARAHLSRPAGADVIEIDNSGAFSDSADIFIGAIEEVCRSRAGSAAG